MQFTYRLALVFVVIIALVLVVRTLMLPDSWGKYGYYRGDAVDEEASRALVHGTNESCKTCHEEVFDIKHAGVHQRLSCESCHAPVTDHVADGEKIADMPVGKGENQTALCLTCHQQVIGRPETFPMIDVKTHLEEMEVSATHECNRCHTVHAPLESINYVKKMRTLRERITDE